eukprot:CAMPEP_0116150462 /NCGR_PEP_ID=MMETSP0329-20121206/19561_1 /TAXON_ID=697910 /ORGANISM="Pseudo-nitzschia arenysensis, Strain B593" /LENGTH=736 /DNA_ID=CAMNT_0003646979 /DNA_START=205 /DNA_END=2415 /DNA_ORIENTATION=+
MITRIAADGKASGMVLISHLEETDTPDLSAPGCKVLGRPKGRMRKRTKFLWLTISLLSLGLIFLAQITVSVTLKRNGIISKDLHDIVSERLLSPVTERVIPELQNRLEHFESKMLDAIEMAKFMAPNFNETLYWGAMNESLSKTKGTARTVTQEMLRPGFYLAQNHDTQDKHPVIMIPGFITSGLEVWKGKSCMENIFRERVWGGLASAQYWLRERFCMMENLALNPITGGDPEGIKVRSSQGFAAADYFIGNDWMWGNYWVWSKILENLADLDYDSNTMSMEAYDWRVATKMLEDRDYYFTHLKHRIEAYHKTSGKKVVLTSHSMGAIVIHYFFAWVTANESQGGGSGGKNWVDEHIHAYVNIAGAHLGVPKAASALTSGEMSDTVFMGGIGNVVERFIPRKARKDLWTTWGSLWSMLPKGGDALWSIGADLPEEAEADSEDTCTESAIPSELQEAIKTNVFVMTDNKEDGKIKVPVKCNKNELLDENSEPLVNKVLEKLSTGLGHSTQSVLDFLLTWGGGMGPNISPVKLYSFAKDRREKPSSRTWHDITKTPLPHAPNMKIYCLYGVGVDTERAFFYKRNPVESVDDEGNNRGMADPPFILDTTIEDPENGIVHGIKYSDGDGSVPLLSLGYMCAGPWRDPKSGLNPSGSEVIIREYKHHSEFTVEDPMRKGPNSSEHVDVLGNIDMLQDFVKIVSNVEVDSITNNIISDIEGIVKRVNDHPDGGLPFPKQMR